MSDSNRIYNSIMELKELAYLNPRAYNTVTCRLQGDTGWGLVLADTNCIDIDLNNIKYYNETYNKLAINENNA